MFTFGIFTTHVPYLAFVVFYAWFLLFGVGRVSSGEIQTGKIYHHTEWISEKHYDGASTQYHFSADFNKSEFCWTGPGDFFFRQKIKYPEYYCNKYRPDGYYSRLFCRPPPAV